MTTYEVNDDVSPFNKVVYIRNRWGDNWYAGSGTIVGNNDILTAAHVVYKTKLGGWSDECRIYPSYDPDSSSKSNNYYTTSWSAGYTDWDENGDGSLTLGDNKSGSLYETEKDLALLSLTTDIGSIYGWMSLKFDFDGGTASKLGYPGKYNDNLYYDEGIVYKDSIDNYFWFNLNKSPNKFLPLLCVFALALALVLALVFVLAFSLALVLAFSFESELLLGMYLKNHSSYSLVCFLSINSLYFLVFSSLISSKVDCEP